MDFTKKALDQLRNASAANGEGYATRLLIIAVIYSLLAIAQAIRDRPI